MSGGMQGIRRKVVHATLYEGVAILMLAVLMQPVTGKGLADTGPFAIACSVIAVLWNMAFNTLFEAWERRQVDRRRTPRRRALHAIGYEGGLVMMTLPVIAWSLDMGWWDAFLTDLGLVALFLVYTFCFNWVFDHLFGLPASAH